MATIKDIAKRCNVSRGTVDRVLNKRGRVNEKTAALILQVAKELNYQPNRAGLALKARSNSYLLKVILTAEGNPFFSDVIAGIKRATKEIVDFGIKVEIIKIKGYHPQVQVKALDDASDANVVLLNPINDEAVKAKLQELREQGVVIVQINTALKDSDCLCYVGCDYYSNGATAANMCGLMATTETHGSKVGSAKNSDITNDLLLITGSKAIASHELRIQGFSDYLQEHYPNLRIAQIIECQDDDQTAYVRTIEALEKREFGGIYIVAAGTAGVCKALQEKDGNNYRVVCSDLTEASRKYMKQGLIKAAICQQPFQQGYHAIDLAFKHLVYKQTIKGDYITQNEVKILANIGG